MGEGMRMRERRLKWCCLAPWKAVWGLSRRVLKRSIDALVLSG